MGSQLASVGRRRERQRHDSVENSVLRGTPGPKSIRGSARDAGAHLRGQPDSVERDRALSLIDNAPGWRRGDFPKAKEGLAFPNPVWLAAVLARIQGDSRARAGGVTAIERASDGGAGAGSERREDRIILEMVGPSSPSPKSFGLLPSSVGNVVPDTRSMPRDNELTRPLKMELQDWVVDILGVTDGSQNTATRRCHCWPRDYPFRPPCRRSSYRKRRGNLPGRGAKCHANDCRSR